MARGLPHCGLRRLPDRSPRPSRRDYRNRRRVLPPQGGNRTFRKTQTSTPQSQDMITKKPELRPGLPLTINFEIPAYWTPEQALAVFKLLDGLREQIGAHYSVQLFELSREQHLHPTTTGADHADTAVDDQSF